MFNAIVNETVTAIIFLVVYHREIPIDLITANNLLKHSIELQIDTSQNYKTDLTNIVYFKNYI